MLSVITVATEIDDGIATVSPAASTAHHDETSLRARRYTGIAVSAQKERVHDLEPRVCGLEAGRRATGRARAPRRAAGRSRTRRRAAVRPSPSTSDDAPIMYRTSSGCTRGTLTSVDSSAYTTNEPTTMPREREERPAVPGVGCSRARMVETATAASYGGGAKVRHAMYRRRALIIGIAGQDGSLLSELLLAEGYDVFGVVRQPVSGRFDNLVGDSRPDRADPVGRPRRAVARRRPDELQAARGLQPGRRPPSSRCRGAQPVLTAEFAAVGCTALLEAIRRVDEEIRFYQASSSEIFGEPREVPQTEETPLAPVTPYGVAKAYAHFITLSYRRRYGLHASSGILYNHESPRRPLDFVTRKITRAAASISLGLEQEVSLGDLDARRDWGYAGDYVRAMWLMLQRETPGDYVIATGENHSVRELVELAFGLRRPRLDGARPRSTSRSSAARRSCTTSSATRARRAASSAGLRRSTSRSSSTCWSTPTSIASGRSSSPQRTPSTADP